MGIVWAMMAVALLGSLALLALTSRRRPECIEFARRRLLIGACLCAASFVGACRRLGGGRPSTGQPTTKLSVMARLGEMWRAMDQHSALKITDAEGYEALDLQMQMALAALEGQAAEGRINGDTVAAIEAAFRERYSHIGQVRYSGESCYQMTWLGESLYASQEALEQQMRILDQLRQKGELPAHVLHKARAVIAKEVALQAHVAALEEAAAGEGESARAAGEALDQLGALRSPPAIEPSDAIVEAAETLVDFTAKPTGSA